MLKNFLKKTIQKKFNEFSLDFFQEIIEDLQDTKTQRTFNFFLSFQDIDLETYVLFSPEKLIDDYLNHICDYYNNAESLMVSLASEKFYIYASLVVPDYTKQTLFTLRSELKDLINEEKEMFIAGAVEVIKVTLANTDFEYEEVH
jgi:hypothetical protein